MSTTTEHHDAGPVRQGLPPPPGGLRRLLYPGFLRAAWMVPLFFGIGSGIVVLCRWWGGWHPIWFGEIIVLVGALIAAPIGFLAGIGAFDYWVRYSIGAPTEPEDHSGHGAYSWRDYFRVNTDHKVIGMQYLATTIFFFLAGGLLAMLVRAELAKPGMQFFDNQTYNGLFSVHASLMIFLFVIPAFAGLANFVVPLMLGAPDMAFPRLNALSYWLLPIAGIMMLPGFGIASEVISVFSRKPIFGYRLMALSLMAILVLGFSVWAHHMFVSGMAPWLRVPMMITTLMIAVPTGIKVFSWLATIWEGKINFATPMLWAVGFVSMFVIGGLSGIYLGAVPIDIHVSDTYFVVAHIHYVLFGGSLFTIFAGIYYWFPKMTGRQYNEKLGKLHFWLTFIGFNLTFFPMHLIGTQGMPRRVSDYAPRFADLNFFISIASFFLGASTLVFLYNMVVSWARGARAPANPWRAHTPEGQGSPPPPGLPLHPNPP